MASWPPLPFYSSLCLANEQSARSKRVSEPARRASPGEERVLFIPLQRSIPTAFVVVIADQLGFRNLIEVEIILVV